MSDMCKGNLKVKIKQLKEDGLDEKKTYWEVLNIEW
jgi:hypothetical protein